MEELGLFGVFLGGALPWLEAVVVVPLGILAGLNPVAVVVAGFTGNLLTSHTGCLRGRTRPHMVAPAPAAGAR